MDKSEQGMFEDMVTELRKIHDQLNPKNRPSYGSNVIDRLDEIVVRLEVIEARLKK